LIDGSSVIRRLALLPDRMPRVTDTQRGVGPCFETVSRHGFGMHLSRPAPGVQALSSRVDRDRGLV
jgi:hypothetical protein